MNKTHWSVWVTIIIAIAGWLTSGIVIVTRLDAWIDFVEQRIEKIIDLCCDEVHKSGLEVLYNAEKIRTKTEAGGKEKRPQG